MQFAAPNVNQPARRGISLAVALLHQPFSGHSADNEAKDDEKTSKEEIHINSFHHPEHVTNCLDDFLWRIQMDGVPAFRNYALLTI